MVEGGGISCYSVPTLVLPIDRSRFSAFSTIQWISRVMGRRMSESSGQATVNCRLADAGCTIAPKCVRSAPAEFWPVAALYARFCGDPTGAGQELPLNLASRVNLPD